MRRDEAYLLDMLIAARDAQAFVSGVTREQLEASRLHQLAVLKALEIIGEATARISEPYDLPALIAAIEPLVPPEEA